MRMDNVVKKKIKEQKIDVEYLEAEKWCSLLRIKNKF